MSRCSGCGQQLAPNARFCALCGRPAAPSTAQTTSPAAMPTGQYEAQPSSDGTRKRNMALAAGGGAVAAAVVLFLGLRASGLLGAKATTTPTAGVLSAPQTVAAPAPVLAAPPVDAKAPAPNPVLAPPPNMGSPMPEDVAAWLRWLKKVEAYRRQLKNESDAALVMAYAEMIKAPLQEMMKEPDEIKEENMTSKDAFAKMGAITAKWNQLASVFQQGPQAPTDWPAGKPNLPQPCAQTAAAYNQMLMTIIQQQAQLQQLAQQGVQAADKSGGSATPDVQNILTQLYSQANTKGMSRSADATVAGADGALNALRDRYTSVPADVDRSALNVQDQSGVQVPSAPSMPSF